MDKLKKLQADFVEVERRVNEGLPGGRLTTRGALETELLDPQPVPQTPPKPPQDQQIRDGDFSWSINGYFETVAAPGTDKVKECAVWFSNDSVTDGVSLSFTDARTSSVNKTLKTTAHSTYNPAYCDWDATAGVARMTGTKSLDTPFPTSPIYPGRTEYIGLICARRSAQIVIPAGSHLGAYLYDNTLGSEAVMQAGSSEAPTGVVRGTPAVTTERRYKIYTRTDKGYTVLSAELTIVGAPSDADFATCDVYLSWSAISGAIEYKIYRHDITAAKYRLLIAISSGATTYADNGHVEAGHTDEGAYPAASTDRVRCYAATSDGDLSNLPVNGVALKWADIFLNIPVPGVLASAAAGNQVLRLQLDMPMDRQMTDVVSTAANARVVSVTGAFTALDTGRTATLLAADGVTVLHGPETITYVDATHVDFATNVATSNVGVILYIVAGGDHGLLVDMVHAGWIAQAKYSSYPDDLTRTLSPAASPTNSTQGGIGPGGDSGGPGDGGISGCVATYARVTMLLGNGYFAEAADSVRRGWMLKSGNHVPNMVLDVMPSDCGNLHIVRTENGLELPCSPRQVLFSGPLDSRGRPLSRLQVGDFLLTCRDGHDECSPISEILATGGQSKVVTYALSPGHKYLAGQLRLRWWHCLIPRFFRRRTEKPNGIYVHNRKIDENQLV